MPGTPLRKMVGAVALAVAVIVTLAVPAGYFALAYRDSAATLAFEARLNAARVSQYIYTHDAMWQYQQLRLAEMIQLPEAGKRPIRQKIYDADGHLVLDEGTALPAPVHVTHRTDCRVRRNGRLAARRSESEAARWPKPRWSQS